MSKFNNLLYGAKSRVFFSEHEDHIRTQNIRLLGRIIFVMTFIISCCALFNLSYSDVTPIRLTYMAFAFLFVFLSLLHYFVFRNTMQMTIFYYVLVMELIFAFLVLIGPVFDPTVIGVFIPVFFIMMPLCAIAPLSIILLVTVIDLVIFSSVTWYFKAPDIALYDTIDAVISSIIGISIGYSVLSSRLSEIVAYDKVAEYSETQMSRALEFAYTDYITGGKSRCALSLVQRDTNLAIEAGATPRFAILLCDINDLRKINETAGHKAGDAAIMDCYQALCSVFHPDSVFRLGGDEFFVFLTDEEYARRASLLSSVREISNFGEGRSFAYGMAVFVPGADQCVDDVYVRADQAMYRCKAIMKGTEA